MLWPFVKLRRPIRSRPSTRSMTARALAVLCGAALLVGLSANDAAAEIDGPCEVTVDGVSIRNRSSSDPADALAVAADAVLDVSISNPGGLRSHTIGLEFAGINWSASNGTDNGATATSGRVSVADYSRYGVGLYRVSGKATLQNGQRCRGALLVRVGGSPLGTAAGAGAAVAAVLGVGAVALATARAAKQARRRALGNAGMIR